MKYSYSLMGIIVILFLFYIVGELMHYLRKKQKLKALKKMPFPDDYKSILHKQPLYPMLNPNEQKYIQFLILRFIEEKNILGVQGMIVDDEVKITIAFYACLLVVNIKHDVFYENLENVLVYPYAFIVNEVKSFGGVYTKERYFLEGQSTNETVVLSWSHVKKNTLHSQKSNVIIHEFAHELDFSSGAIDGMPPMERNYFSSWVKHLFPVFTRLNRKTLKGRFLGKYKFFGAYAATNEAEFFAVATERFFQDPITLKKKFPMVYHVLKDFYKLDTASRVLSR